MPVILSEVEGSRCATFKATSAGSLDFARDDMRLFSVQLRQLLPKLAFAFRQLLRQLNLRDDV